MGRRRRFKESLMRRSSGWNKTRQLNQKNLRRRRRKSKERSCRSCRRCIKPLEVVVVCPVVCPVVCLVVCPVATPHRVHQRMSHPSKKSTNTVNLCLRSLVAHNLTSILVYI